jgi:hypothetical protein
MMYLHPRTLAHSHTEAVEEALQEYQHDMSDISRRTGMDMDANSDPSYACLD